MAALLRTAQDGPDMFVFGERTYTPETLVDKLRPLVSEARQARIEAVLAGRTYGVVPVVEGLVNTGNISAVMRSAEALGYQRFDVIAAQDVPFKTSVRTTQGAEKWLDVHVWSSTDAALDALQADGYRIAATHLDATAVPLADLDFTQPTALVFGNELHGVSERLLARADLRCCILTPGFTQSFNISVAAAVALHHAYADRLRRQGHHGDLDDATRARLRARWYFLSVRAAADVLAR